MAVRQPTLKGTAKNKGGFTFVAAARDVTASRELFEWGA